MNLIPSLLLKATLPVLLVGGLVSCQNKPSEAVLQAQATAKAADDRVALLEQQVADIKAGKSGSAGDQETVEHMSKSQLKALDRQLGEAKKRAMESRSDANNLASTPAARQPRITVVEVPAGTRLSVRLNGDLGTDKDQAGDAWEGTLAEEVLVGAAKAWPAGTAVKGVVSQSTPAGRLASGKGGLSIKLTSVGQNGVEAGTYVVVGTARGARDAQYIGGTAALGALIGMLSDKNHKGDHALGGAVAGAAAGTALAAGTADTVIRIPASKAVEFSLTAPERVTVR